MSAATAAATITDIASPEEFSAILAAHTLVLADFHALWCRKCKFLLPRLRKLAAAYPAVAVVTVDVNNVSRLPKEFGIEAMPTFVLLKDAVKVDIVSGGAEAGVVIERLRQALDRHG